VRGLIVVVFVIGVGLGWIVRQARVQRDAVAAIKHAGGTVYYDWEWNNGTAIFGGRPWAPAWLSGLIGVDNFGRVIAVRGHASMTQSDAVMAAVGRITRIQYLSVDQWYITDADLAQLTRLTDLHDLFLSNGQLTDAGMTHLDALSKFPFLSVSGTQVADAWLAHLEGLNELSCLSVSGTLVTDAGLVHLKGLPNLMVLLLNHTRASDSGVNELQQSLSRLWIIR
jgi:hypothetical protein